jgi:acyl phosphate:glycerol-3-phosphate acyltransferase
MIHAFWIFPTAYLVGSIPFGFLIAKWVKGVDVRTIGSGNIGMTNVWRAAGAPWGVLTLLMDISKGVFTIWLAHHYVPQSDLIQVLSGLCVLLGNIFSLFMRFKGGKGVGVSIGVFFSLLPLESAIGVGVFVVAVLLWRMISVGSLLGATTMMLLSFYNQGVTWLTVLALAATCVIWWTHGLNLRRILDGTENKVGRKSKSRRNKKR